MNIWLILVSLLLAGAVSQKRGRPRCKKPNGKFGNTMMDGDCGQTVCMKEGKERVWKQCPRPATQEKLLEIEKLLKRLEEKIDGECGSKKPVENEIIFEENGETFVQKQSYSPITNESVITVPAHGNFEAMKFILHGKSSDSPAAGKMIVSSENACSLEDIPDNIIPEDMITENQSRRVTRQNEEVKVYRIKSDMRIATKEEQENLSETMKSECAGKSVIVSSIETVNEEEFLKRSDFSNFSNNLKRVKKNDTDELKKGSVRNGCELPYYGCAVTNATSCFRWTLQPGNHAGNQPLIKNVTVHVTSWESYCTKCCRDANTIYPQCSCINNKQRFSTAFAISREADGFGYDCLKLTSYCKWDNTSSISDCNYTTPGSCIDSGCPILNCSTQKECNDLVD